MDWNINPAAHESSNGMTPRFDEFIDLSSSIPLLQAGDNVLAVAVWNNRPTTTSPDDLVLVPRLSINRTPTISYLANATDPGVALNWVQPGFDDSSWQLGNFGIGFDTSGAASGLLTTTVPEGTRSIYTRSWFQIDDPTIIERIAFAADYDDAAVIWINGVEVFRYSEMPDGIPTWDSAPEEHESSNAVTPRFSPVFDITNTTLPVLQSGANLLAIGVYNADPGSSDLVLVPSITTAGGRADNCDSVPNPSQIDSDADGIGDACDNCTLDFNAGQADSDGDGVGDACDNCPFDDNASQVDTDGDTIGDLCDNCPADANLDQADADGDGIGDQCEVSIPQESEPNDSCATANPVQLGETVIATKPGTDRDHYSLTLTEDTVFQIETAGTPGGDTVVGVFDAAGNQLYGCDDDNPTPNNFFSAFSCCLPPGNYCVAVKGYQDRAISNYSVTFLNAGSCDTDPDPAIAGCTVENTFGACSPF